LNIIVCVKQVPDPEAPISGYRVDSESRRVVPVGIPPVISPFDENALEAALRLRELRGGKVTALSVGHNLSKAVLRKTLFAGADDLILVNDDAFDPHKRDAMGTAWILGKAVEKIGRFDLIMTGRQASDTNAGVVGTYLAELLAIPAVTLAQKIDCSNGNVRIERVMPDGYEVVEVDTPALITVSPEIGELRKLNMNEMREAKKKPILMWTSKDIPLDEMPSKHLNLARLLLPRRERKCLFIEAGSPAKAGEKLAVKLREDNVI
jgi:electron transfer flavoprotein beta subunit